MKPTLYHCRNARSFRPLWAMEELGMEYDLVVLPFPPRVHYKPYLEINPLGTIPFFDDGKAKMSESTGICHYLAETQGPTELAVRPDDDRPAANRYKSIKVVIPGELTRVLERLVSWLNTDLIVDFYGDSGRA